MSTVTLRPWQRGTFDRFRADDSPDFLAVATPGAGKTTFALTCARATLANERRRLIVVAPTSHLKVQWSLAAHRMGLQLDPDWAPGQGLARDVHGLVTTYQQVTTGDAAAKLRGLAADGMVILDEVHHAGDERAWGDGIRQAFELAAKRLSLSGTPFRSDSAQIPFVRYDAAAEGDIAHADYTYGYGDALHDGGVVRPVYFPRVDGQMEWSTPSGEVLRATFDDALAHDQVSARLRTALSLDGDWLVTVLRQAHDRLQQIRREQHDAGGLIIAVDQEHAQGISRLLRNRFNVPADIVVSDDPSASKKIAEFTTNDRPWLVAVRMVSEGVDIPRLRVGVYATTTSTELFFRQAVGRFVRWQAGRPSQKAYVYVPDDPRLRHHAFQIAEARRHVLNPPTERDDEATAELDAQVSADDELAEQLSLFSVVSSTATGISFHAVTEAGVEHFDDEPDPPDPVFVDDPTLAIELPEVPTEAGLVPWGSLSVAEQKDDLRTRNADVAKRLVDITGWTHPRVQGEMNRLAGVTKVSTATIDQLQRRLRYAESWLRRLKRAADLRQDGDVAERLDGWTCPDCGRTFGRNRQSHDCAPGLSLEEYFETGPAHERPVFDAVMQHLATVGPVHTDIVSVGIFLKNPRKFAELRAKDRWIAIGFTLDRRARHPTITRKVVEHNDRFWHVANVARPDQVDEQLCDLLTEAYEQSSR